MSSSRRGFTLVELVVLIVVIGVAAAGVLLLFQNTVRGSAHPQMYKQSLAIAEAMLDEILLASYDGQPGTGTRANFDDVDDYNGFNTAPGGITDIQGNPIPGLGAYNVSVTVLTAGAATLNDTPASLAPVAESKRVTVNVTVTGHPEVNVNLDGYRLRYAAP